MKSALIVMIGLWLPSAVAADEVCSTEVLRDAMMLQKVTREIDVLVSIIPMQMNGIPPEKQTEAASRLLNTYRSHYFRKVRAFRDQHGDVDCVTDADGLGVRITLKDVYANLDKYEAETPPVPDCDPAFAQAFRDASFEVQGSMAAIQEVLERMKNGGGELNEKDKRFYVQVLQVFRDQTKRFRERHPEHFRCKIKPEQRVADSDSFDGYVEVIQAELDRLR